MRSNRVVKMTSYLTDAEQIALAVSELNRDTPYGIQNCRHGHFSIARHYGGINYNGRHYIYIPKTDELIRDNVLKWVTDRRKRIKQEKLKEDMAKQERLMKS